MGLLLCPKAREIFRKASFPPQKKIGETVVYHIWRYPKFFLILSCVYFNVVHIKNDTDTGETNGFLSLKCASYREFPTSQSMLALGLDVLSHRHDGMKNWLPAFVQKKYL